MALNFSVVWSGVQLQVRVAQTTSQVPIECDRRSFGWSQQAATRRVNRVKRQPGFHGTPPPAPVSYRDIATACFSGLERPPDAGTLRRSAIDSTPVGKDDRGPVRPLEVPSRYRNQVGPHRMPKIGAAPRTEPRPGGRPHHVTMSRTDSSISGEQWPDEQAQMVGVRHDQTVRKWPGQALAGVTTGKEAHEIFPDLMLQAPISTMNRHTAENRIADSKNRARTMVSNQRTPHAIGP